MNSRGRSWPLRFCPPVRAELCESALGVLTPAEREVALSVVDSGANREIAASRGVSQRTVANRDCIGVSKLRVHGRLELIRRLVVPPIPPSVPLRPSSVKSPQRSARGPVTLPEVRPGGSPSWSGNDYGPEPPVCGDCRPGAAFSSGRESRTRRWERVSVVAFRFAVRVRELARVPRGSVYRRDGERRTLACPWCRCRRARHRSGATMHRHGHRSFRLERPADRRMQKRPRRGRRRPSTALCRWPSASSRAGSCVGC